MKYAFMTFSCPQWTLEEVLAAAQRYGYDGVELRVDANHNHGVEVTNTPEQRASARQMADTQGVALCCVATSCKFADPATVAQNVADAQVRIDLAADLGAHVVRVFGGKIPQGLSRQQAIDTVVQALTTLVDQAARRNVYLALETHDDWCDPQDVLAVVSQVNHPYVGVNWDYMHTLRVAKTSLDEAFAALGPYIRHVHFHDGSLAADKLEFLPIGQGEYDQRRVLELLRSVEYDGYLSGEWINWEPAETHLPRELRAIRQIEQAGA
jgi:sugar phosphate isomerase/epimerase